MCDATAEAILTSDYQRGPIPKLDIIRKCDIAGTEEADIAKQHKDKVKAWRRKYYSTFLLPALSQVSVFGQNDEERGSYIGRPMLGNGNGHRIKMNASMTAASERLGREITLEDTYDEGRNVPGGNPFLDTFPHRG